MKSNYIERRFKMNANTTIIIKSKKDGDIYKNVMTVTHESVGLEPLISINNPSRSDLADKIANINLEDDQVDMFEGQNE